MTEESHPLQRLADSAKPLIWKCGICGGETEAALLTCNYCGEPQNSAFNEVRNGSKQ